MRTHWMLHVGVVVVAMMGCREAPPTAPTSAEAAVSSLGRLYGEYVFRNQNTGPPDEATFRRFIESFTPEQRQSVGLTDLDQALLSPRDGQPYEIRYGLSARDLLRAGGIGNQAIVIHERQGVAGRRWTATAQGIAAEADEDEFRRALR